MEWGVEMAWWCGMENVGLFRKGVLGMVVVMEEER